MSKELIVNVQSLPDMKAEIHRMKYQVQLIQQLIRDVLIEGTHYGIIPGTKEKTLYKSGAEKICLLFRLRPRFKEVERELGGDHKQYNFECELHDSKGAYIGQGVGSCSTKEAKYRYRRGEGMSTGMALPREYWNLKKTNPQQAKRLIGGPGYFPKKDENGEWMIFQEAGDKVENPDIADVYNTCKKMGKKRSFVDATLTCTGASDCFKQDLDESFEEGEVVPEDVEQHPEPEITSKVKFTYDLSLLPPEKQEVAKQVAMMSGAKLDDQGLFRSIKRIPKLDNAAIQEAQ